MKSFACKAHCLLIVLILGTFNVCYSSYHLHTVFSDYPLRERFAGFLDSVLKQTPSETLYSYIDSIYCEQSITDKDYYEKILAHVSELKHFFPLYTQLKALFHQKKILTEQSLELLKDKKEINGFVEIGTPGTYCATLQNHLINKGKWYVINDKKRAADVIQSWSFNPLKKFVAYDQFIALQDYEALAKNDLASQSVDLVVCYIGLHHIPQEKIEQFVGSISRILRPGGVFLLRDHDCSDSSVESLIYAAHIVYNALMTGEPVETECNEYRNFKPLDYWITRVQSYGFECQKERLTQAGDPTKNTLLKFVKVVQTQEEKEDLVADELKKNSDYQRPLIQTFLSAPEWFNVDAASEYAQFIHHTPFYQFPYFNTIKTYWQIFAQSFNVARAQKGYGQTLFSESTLMNLFVGISMTLEYGAKGVVSWPVSKIYKDVESKTIQLYIKSPATSVCTIDARIKLMKDFPEIQTQLIEIPRYKEFLDIVQRLVKNNVHIIEIAGQTQIQYKVRYKKADCISFERLNGCKKDYEWYVPTQPEYIYAVLTVDVKQMKALLNYIYNNAIELLYIHDF
jgi:SAM-dependent methyltransferase